MKSKRENYLFLAPLLYKYICILYNINILYLESSKYFSLFFKLTTQVKGADIEEIFILIKISSPTKL